MKSYNLTRFPVVTVVLTMFVLLTNSCQFSDANVIKGNGELADKTHELAYFNHIELSGVYTVILSQGPEALLNIETDNNLHELIEISQADNTLYIAFDRESILRPTKLEIHITYPELYSLTIKGAGRISATDKLVTEKLLLDMSGATDLQLEVEVASMHTRVSGAGNIKLSGVATNHQIDLSGASNFQGEELISHSTTISLSGAGSASVYASESLGASMSGVGKITYHGDPSHKNINKTGLGSVSSAR